MPRFIPKILLALCLALFAGVSAFPFSARAQEDPFAACAPPDFDALDSEWEAQEKTESSHRQAFQEAQNAYHGYADCLLSAAYSRVLRGSFALKEGEEGDLMTPSVACISEDRLKKAIQGTEPLAILPLLLDALEGYKAHLRDLAESFDAAGTLDQADQDALSASAKLRRAGDLVRRIRLQAEQEIESSLVALDISLGSLKEMRLAFVAHVRFQCILRQLERYSQLLSEIRSLFEGLPKALQNASVSP